MRFRGDTFQQRSGESGFANAGFARQQHHLSFAALGLDQRRSSEFEFFFSTNKLGQAARVQSLEAALDRSGSQRHPGSHGPYMPLRS